MEDSKQAATLSGEIGLAKRETIVSRLMGAVLGDTSSGPVFLDALRATWGEEPLAVSGLEIEAVLVEFSSRGSRNDIVVVLRRDDELEILVIEVKVSAEEGDGQIERYERDFEDDAYSEKILGKLELHGSSRGLKGMRVRGLKLCYLTVVDDQGPRENSRVLRATFDQWRSQLDSSSTEEPSSNLGGALLMDVLEYLGPEQRASAKHLNSISPDSTAGECAALLAEAGVLRKQILQRICATLKQSIDESSDFKTPETPYDSHGIPELSLWKESWNPIDGRPYKVKLARNIDEALLSKQGGKFNVSLLPDPYSSANKLGETKAREHDERRIEFLRLVSELSPERGPVQVVGADKRWEPGKNNILQVLWFPLHVRKETTLRDLAQQIIDGATQVDALVTPVLKELNAGDLG